MILQLYNGGIRFIRLHSRAPLVTRENWGETAEALSRIPLLPQWPELKGYNIESERYFRFIPNGEPFPEGPVPEIKSLQPSVKGRAPWFTWDQSCFTVAINPGLFAFAALRDYLNDLERFFGTFFQPRESGDSRVEIYIKVGANPKLLEKLVRLALPRFVPGEYQFALKISQESSVREGNLALPEKFENFPSPLKDLVSVPGNEEDAQVRVYIDHNKKELKLRHSKSVCSIYPVSRSEVMFFLSSDRIAWFFDTLESLAAPEILQKEKPRSPFPTIPRLSLTNGVCA